MERINLAIVSSDFFFQTICVVNVVISHCFSTFFLALSLGREGPFICDMCGSNCSKIDTFRNHIRKFHLKRHRVKMYCDLCPKSFDQKSLIATHLLKDHLKIWRYSCKLCEYKSYRRSTLNQHVLSHEPRTECKICHKQVLRVQQHMRIHIKVKCPDCSRILSKTNLLEHKKFHCKNIQSKKGKITIKKPQRKVSLKNKSMGRRTIVR